MKKCGSVCIYTFVHGKMGHSILLTDYDETTHKLEFETWGKHYTCDFFEFIDGLVFNYENNSTTPTDGKHDGILRMVGFEK